MAEALNHFVDREQVSPGRYRARVHAYPRYYRDGDPATGAWAETDCTIVASDHPELSDWMAKKGVWSLYGKNSGAVCYKHLGRALVMDLRALVVVKADRTFEVIAQPTQSTPTISGDSVSWAGVFAGVDRQVQTIPDQFRDVFTISAAARTQIGTWLQNHGYGGQLGSCYLAFAYKLTPLGFDGTDAFDFAMDADGEPFDQQTAREHFGRFNFRAAGRLKQFIEAGAFTAIDAPLSEEGMQPSVPKLKRFFRKDGDWWFLEGARLDQLSALPAGRVQCNLTKTIQEGVSGYSGCIDTYLRSDTPTTNNGSAVGLFIYQGARRILIAFDLSDEGLAGATVTNASLSLYTDVYNYNQTVNISGYQVFKPWQETDSTWNQWDASGGNEWGTAGCSNADDGGSENSGDGSGADCVSTANFAETSLSGYNAWWTFGSGQAGLKNLVQDWIDGVYASTRGMVLVCLTSGGGAAFASAQNTTAENRPLLTIVYEVPAAGTNPSGVFRSSIFHSKIFGRVA